MSENHAQSWELGRGQADVSLTKRIWRVLGNIAKGTEETRAYPARTAAVLRNRIPWIGRSWAPGALADHAIEMFWNGLPPRIRSWKSTQNLGRRIHQRACRVQPRSGGSFTRFFRNVPQLELVRDLLLERPSGVPLKIISLGCSTGAELYSTLWLLRTARPTQKIQALGLDMWDACIPAAARAVYPRRVPEVAAISKTSYETLFTREGKVLVVQDWVKEDVIWTVGDACSPDLAERFGLHDLVIANNFLFQMPPERSEACLRNLTRLVAPNGYLVISGVDLDVRSRTLRELDFVPVTARCEDIHAAEDVHAAWPLRFWGLEPIDRTRQDWAARYATVFMRAAQ
jgi:chemotaxis protein methyltransferase CheR